MDDWVLYAFFWYISGLPLALFMFARDKGVIKIGDIKAVILAGGIGPLWLVVLLLDILNGWFERRKDTVLWKSKKEKVKELLFTEEDETDNQYPYR